jgi:hypothetical protein
MGARAWVGVEPFDESCVALPAMRGFPRAPPAAGTRARCQPILKVLCSNGFLTAIDSYRGRLVGPASASKSVGVRRQIDVVVEVG